MWNKIVHFFKSLFNNSPNRVQTPITYTIPNHGNTSTYRVHLEPDNNHLLICVKQISGNQFIYSFLANNALQQLNLPNNYSGFQPIHIFFRDRNAANNAALEHWVINGNNSSINHHINYPALLGSQYQNAAQLTTLLANPNCGI